MTSETPTYRLYIANKNYSSWSLRPWLLMRHYSIPFEEHQVSFQGGHGGRQPEWKSFSPTATVPCLHHFPPSPSPNTTLDTSPSRDDPIVLWDSLSIILHLADNHPSLPIFPPLSSPSHRAWALSATSEMHSSFSELRHEMYFNVSLRVEFSLSPAATAQFARLNELLTEGLTRFGGPYLAGQDLGAVDAFYAPFVLRLRTYVGSEEGLSPEAKRWTSLMEGLEGMREWVEGALRDGLREGVGEEETLQGRRLIEDLRKGEEEVVRVFY